MAETRNIIIEKFEDPRRISYMVLDAPGGRMLLKADDTCYELLTQQGWQQHNHENFDRVENPGDNRSIILKYFGEKADIHVLLPEIDFEKFKLTREVIEDVVKQMKQTGRGFHDPWSEFSDGLAIYWQFDSDAGQFIESTTDIVVGAFHREEMVSDEHVIDCLLEKATWFNLQKAGFELSN